MSVDGFRGTFLLRQGVLSTRDGAGLLRVERETYDVVLERFPWSWEWVKLPWMEAPAAGGMVMAMNELSLLQLNARDLERELAWFARLLDARFQAYFGQDAPRARPVRRSRRPT